MPAMVKAGRRVEFRGTWWDAREKYYTQNFKKAGHNREISCKSGTHAKIGTIEEFL